MARAVKEAHIHQSKPSHIEQKHWEIQSATPVGWYIAIHSRAEINK